MCEQERCDVRERAGRHERDRLFAFREHFRHERHRVKPGGLEVGFRQRRAIQAGLAVHRGRDDGLGNERALAPHRKRRMQADQRADAQGVIRRLFDGLVSAAGGHGADIQHGACVCKHPCDRVVMSRVAIQDDWDLFHIISSPRQLPEHSAHGAFSSPGASLRWRRSQGQALLQHRG